MANTINLNKEITWNVGTGSEYWWEVKGCCKEIYSSGNTNDVCPPIKIQEDCPDKTQSIQILLSPTIEDLCKDLKNNNFNWKVCSIRRWSRPAENEFLTSADECNILESIEYKSIPACITLSTDKTVIEKIKFKKIILFSKCNNDSCIGNVLSYQAQGQINLGGSAEYPVQPRLVALLSIPSLTYTVEEKIRFKTTVNIKELQFSEKYTNEYIPTLNLVPVLCDDCGDMPNIFYVDNNLQNLNIFSQFLNKNNYELEDEIPIQYNRINNLWLTNKKYESKDKKESWRFLIDFGCTNESDSDLYYWRFSFLMTFISNKIKKETKLLLKVPSKFICQYSINSIIDFKYNTKNKYIFINYRAYYDEFYFIDDIGLFQSSYWEDNPEINIKITKDKIKNRINKKTIYY